MPITISKNKLKYLYLDKKLSSKKIAEIFSGSKSTILKQLHRYNLPTRKVKARISIPKSKLELLYTDEKLSVHKIAELFNTSPATIHGRLHEYNIPLRSISEALKGRIPWNKGEHLSEGTKRKLSKISREFWSDPNNKEKIKIRNKKISESMKGDKNPMKRPEVRKKMGQKMKGKLVGNKNPAKKLEVRKKISERSKGHKVPIEVRKKISENLKGRYVGVNNPFYGKHHTKEVREKSRKRAIKQLISGELINKTTSIELKMERELIKRKIHHKKQFPLENMTVADFYLPLHRIVIYCDGIFWHKSDWAKKQGRLEKDRRQRECLENNNYRVFRFCETEINESIEKCIDVVVSCIEGNKEPLK